MFQIHFAVEVDTRNRFTQSKSLLLAPFFIFLIMWILYRQKVLQLFAKSTKFTWLFKSLGLVVVLLYIVYLMSNQYSCLDASLFFTKVMYNKNQPRESYTLPPTNTTHIVFGLASSSKTWRSRRSYAEAWWKPNVTRGFVFLERMRNDFLPWPPSSPMFYVSEDTSRYEKYNQHKTRQAIRMVRMIVEMFRAENRDVRWYVLMDDDTIIFVDNLVGVLSKYDHRKFYYIGANSESVASNSLFSFDMAFGGGGYALSYPLAEVLVENMDDCIKRYPNLYGSDHMIQSCVSDLGIPLTQEKGFHQMDLHGDVSGFLSAHPQSPLVSFHHFDAFDPLFPYMNRNESFNHLMIAAKTDESRLFQQTVCYFQPENWTLSLSWGYSAQIYRGYHRPNFLVRPLQTFLPWSKFSYPPFMFNTRIPSKDPCEVPQVLFFNFVDMTTRAYIVTSYNRSHPHRLPSCSHNATNIVNIRVLSPLSRFEEVGIRRECCDIVKQAGTNEVEVEVRKCKKHEFLA